MTTAITRKLAVFAIVLSLFIANMFAPYEIHSFNFTTDNKQAFFEMDGVQQRLEIVYDTSSSVETIRQWQNWQYLSDMFTYS